MPSRITTSDDAVNTFLKAARDGLSVSDADLSLKLSGMSNSTARSQIKTWLKGRDGADFRKNPFTVRLSVDPESAEEPWLQEDEYGFTSQTYDGRLFGFPCKYRLTLVPVAFVEVPCTGVGDPVTKVVPTSADFASSEGSLEKILDSAAPEGWLDPCKRIAPMERTARRGGMDLNVVRLTDNWPAPPFTWTISHDMRVTLNHISTEEEPAGDLHTAEWDLRVGFTIESIAMTDEDRTLFARPLESIMQRKDGWDYGALEQLSEAVLKQGSNVRRKVSSQVGPSG